VSLRTFARGWLPPAARRSLATLAGRRLRFEPVRGTWADAVARSSGYDHASILQRVVVATREVVAGRAAYERDSVLFHEPSVRFEILAPLLRAALRHGGRLDVIDFGGSLGTLYRQCRPHLPLATLRWQVVEQPAFVAAGRAEFTTAELSFHDALNDLPGPVVPRVLVASSVLQYLPDPMRHLKAWAAAREVDTVIIDRTPMSGAAEHALAIQHVPRHIYPASYPCWVLSRVRLLEAFPGWQTAAEFEGPEGAFRLPGGPRFTFNGLILERST
jgi:putative methyltransferase (TIGR04325 family)